MADRPRLQTPMVHVVMEDGAVFDVQTANRDLVAFDLQRGPRKWPGPDTAPMLYQTFLAWKAVTRESLIDPKTPWDVFVATALEVRTTKADGTEDAVDVDPSPPGPEPG